jgi:twitching motility protein PilT
MLAPAGLVLVTGATGSGKSTTLAACLDWLNQTADRHIVTIEDPVEYQFEDKISFFSQREVSSDTSSFAKGLRAALRQSPDVILVGEIRDSETATTALQAAETGHLVLSTLHSSSVTDTLERLTHLFPPAERQAALLLLSTQLIGILSQRLLPGKEGGMQVVVEHLHNEGATRDWIRTTALPEINDHLRRATTPGNRSFLSSLVEAVETGRIEEAVAEQASANATEFRRSLRGIS